MLKMKIIPIRQVLAEMVYHMILAISLLLIVVVLLLFFHFFEQEWKNDLIENSSTLIQKTSSKQQFANRILKSELFLYSQSLKEESTIVEWKMEKAEPIKEYHQDVI